MKTNRLLAAMLLPVLFACTKEDDSGKNPNSGEKFDFTITVSEDPSSITKASFDDAKGIYWTAGGKAGIVNADGKIESDQLSNIYENGQKASFVFSGADGGEYKFFYPYHSDANNETIPFWVDPNQSTSAGYSADCFAVVSTGLVTLDATNHDTPAETHYKVVGSYIRFAPFGKAGETVKYIITRGESGTVSGRYFVKWDNNFDHYDLNAETVTLTVDGEYATVAAKEEAKGLYAAVLPVKSQNTYTVVTDKGYYVFESASEKEFKFGAIKDIPLNLGNATRRTPDHLYVVGDATTAGWNGNEAIELTKKEGENKFVAEGIVLVPAAEGFKFNTRKSPSDDAWSNAFVNAGDNKLAYYVNIPSDKDKKFTVDKPGIYNLTVDFDTFTVTTELVEALIPTVMNGTDNPESVTMQKVSDGVYSGVLYVGSGDQNHDILIKMGDNYYYEGSDYTQVEFSNSKFEYNSEEGAVRSHTDKKGWWLNDGNYATERYYRITLDLKKNSVKIRLAQGKKYWMNGDFCGWGKSKAIQEEANEQGIVSWTVTVDQSNIGNGTFKICGEYTLEGISGKSEWDGEWYYSNATDAVYNLSWEAGNMYGESLPVYPYYPEADKKWRLSEFGTYTIEFDTVNLTLKVTKQ